MYYSMNNMIEQLTNNGIMMSNGELIATDVMVEHNILANEIRYSYKNEHGERWGTMNYHPHITPMYNIDNKLTGLLANKPDPANEWYLFWSAE